MNGCVREKGVECAERAEFVLQAREGGMEQEKCGNCLDALRRRSGDFDGLYRVHPIVR